MHRWVYRRVTRAPSLRVSKKYKIIKLDTWTSVQNRIQSEWPSKRQSDPPQANSSVRFVGRQYHSIIMLFCSAMISDNLQGEDVFPIPGNVDDAATATCEIICVSNIAPKEIRKLVLFTPCTQQVQNVWSILRRMLLLSSSSCPRMKLLTWVIYSSLIW